MKGALMGMLQTNLLDLLFVGFEREQPGHAKHIPLIYEYIPGQ